MNKSLRNELAATAALGLPLAMTQAAHAALHGALMTQIAKLGPDVMAGAAMGYQLYLIVFAAFMGILLALPPLLAQAHAAGRGAECGRLLRDALGLTVGLSFLGALPLVMTQPLLVAINQTDLNASTGAVYAWSLIPGLAMALGFIALRGILSALDDGASVALALPVGALASLPWLPSIAKFGIVAVYDGFMIAGLAAFTGFGAMNLFLLWRITRHQTARSWLGASRSWRPSLWGVQQILIVGLPISGALLFENALFASALFLIAPFGNESVAAHQIANTTTTFSFMIPLGLSAATTIRVALAAGREDKAGVKTALWAGLILVMGFMIAMAALYYGAPQIIIGLFVPLDDAVQSGVIILAASFFSVAAFYQIVDGLQVTLFGALRGLKDTRAPMWIAGLSYWLVGFPLAWLLAYHTNLEGRGVWWGLAAGLAAAGFFLALRWRYLLRAMRS